MTMYYLFAGERYQRDYAEGGTYDFIGRYDTLEEARRVMTAHVADWAHIADANMTIIESVSR